MIKIIAFIWSCFVVSTCLALDKYLTGEPPKDEKAFYARIENDLKKEYEAVVASLTRKKPLTKAEHDKALDSIKFIFYNRANVYATCWGEYLLLKALGHPTIEQEAHFKSCIDEKLLAFMIMGELTDHVGALPPGTGDRCEMLARLFERELLLPPYDFLKQQSGSNHLLDANIYNQCIRYAH